MHSCVWNRIASDGGDAWNRFTSESPKTSRCTGWAITRLPVG